MESIGWGAEIEPGDPRHLIVFISGYGRPGQATFHFAEFATRFPQTKLFLRDGTNSLYAHGITGVTTTSEESVEFLRYMIDRLAPERVTFVSGSVGSHPTVMWGCELGVDDIHLIGAVTDMARAVDSPRAGMPAFEPLREHVEQLLAQGYPHANLRHYLLENGHRVSSIDLFYGMDDPTDIEQARNISDLPNMRSTIYHRGDHIRVPMFVQRRDMDLTNRINRPIERPADLRASGLRQDVDLGYAVVRLE
jgi:hypothetical protein